MKDIIRIKTTNKPQPIEHLGDGYYYYNYNITPCKIESVDLENNLKKLENGWSYTPIYMYGVPTYKEIVKNVIRQYITQEEEFDLINSYNKTILTGVLNEQSRNDYSDYLLLLENIKKEIKQNFNKK